MRVRSAKLAMEPKHKPAVLAAVHSQSRHSRVALRGAPEDYTVGTYSAPLVGAGLGYCPRSASSSGISCFPDDSAGVRCGLTRSRAIGDATVVRLITVDVMPGATKANLGRMGGSPNRAKKRALIRLLARARLATRPRSGPWFSPLPNSPGRRLAWERVRRRSQSIRRSFQLAHIALIIPASRLGLRSPVTDSAGARLVSPRGTARRLRSSEVRLRRRFPVLPGYLAKCERNRGARHLVACNGVPAVSTGQSNGVRGSA